MEPVFNTIITLSFLLAALSGMLLLATSTVFRKQYTPPFVKAYGLIGLVFGLSVALASLIYLHRVA